MEHPVDLETRQAVELLYSSLLAMGQQSTNPVLLLLGAEPALMENQKYPQGLLQFSGGEWRAYYHCHPSSGHGRSGKHHFDGEHGHFHLFMSTDATGDKWTHVIALAMDPQGQPLGWFTVNHWVTGESWVPASELTEKLQSIPYDIQETLLTRWLLAMVVLYRDQLNELLECRDKLLNENVLAGDNILQDRSLYLLSESPIDLKIHLETILCPDQ